MRSSPTKPYVIAIATGDFHLWDVPPAYRENEPNWWTAMQRPIDQIKAVWRKHHEPPILCGGDVFDRWKASPELIYWALKHLPPMYAVAGNHDVENHRLDNIHRSGYGVLVEAGRIVDLKPGVPHPVGDKLMVHGFPHGTEVKSVASHLIDGFNVALIHSYVWKKGHGYTGAPEDRRVGAWEGKLANFSHAFFSDNHHAHAYQGKHTLIVNCGCIMRRRRDEAKYEPRIWTLYSDGEVEECFLDCSQDIYARTEESATVVENNEIDAEELIASLGELKQTSIDYVAAVKKMLTTMKVSKDVREKVMEAVGG